MQKNRHFEHNTKNDQSQMCDFQVFNKSHLGYFSYIYSWDIPQLFWVTVTCLDRFVYFNFVQNKKGQHYFSLYKKYKLI